MMNDIKKAEYASLNFQNGSSDKVYNVHLVPEGDLWMVKFAYGRRGSVLNTGNKTRIPVPYDKAKKAFDQLVSSKLAKGYYYTTSVGAPIQVVEKKETGVIPQLLNPVSEEDLEYYFKSKEWCMQEKFDGENRLIIKKDDVLQGANRKGQTVALSAELQEAFKDIPNGTILNGEDLGAGAFALFDNISEFLQKEPYSLRYNTLDSPTKHVFVVAIAKTEGQKRTLFKKLKENNAEGVVFKKMSSLYAPGRPASGGDMLKFKFYETASVTVTANHATKSSFEMSVFDSEKNIVCVGNCTVMVNQTMPPVGSIVEVRYLYWYPEGSLYQPVFLRVRENDITLDECTIEQLKKKQGL